MSKICAKGKGSSERLLECPECLHKVDICDGKILRQGKVPGIAEEHKDVVIDLGQKRKEKLAAKEVQPDKRAA